MFALEWFKLAALAPYPLDTSIVPSPTISDGAHLRNLASSTYNHPLTQAVMPHTTPGRTGQAIRNADTWVSNAVQGRSY